jgi:HD-GYP domain-containing protein (c-di-GMP phosphodiesterase class II)
VENMDLEERKEFLRRVDQKLVSAGIAGRAEVQALYFDNYTALRTSGKQFNPVEFASFDIFSMWRVIDSTDDPETIKHLVKVHNRDLGDLALGAFNIERRDCALTREEKELPLRVNRVCSENLRNYLQGIKDGMRYKDLSLDIEPEWINDGASLMKHGNRVGRYAAALGECLGYGPVRLVYLRDEGEFHDTGKIMINDKILENKGLLSDDQRTNMKKHPVHGVEIFFQMAKKFNVSQRDVEYLLRISDAAAFHHERWDGAGYPYGKRGEGIPEDARIVSLADAFDAMSSGRPHSEPKSVDYMRKEILGKGKGTQFDPNLCTKGVFDRLVSTYEQMKKVA